MGIWEELQGGVGMNMIKNYCTVVGLFGFLYSFLLGGA